MRTRVLQSLVIGVLGACTVSNTGNPSTGEAPEGIELVRSSLARDTSPDVSASELTRFASDQRAFAFDMYAQLSANEPNLFISPYSIATALAMTYAGADGATKQEMADALRFTLPEPALHAAFNSVDLALSKRADEIGEEDVGDGFRLSTTNATFVAHDEDVQSDFLDVLAQHYDAGLFLADFEREPERERLAINSWVEDQTEQRIEELLPDMSIDSDTRAVLVNTIYFKASWRNKFDPRETKAAPFHAPSGEVTVQMMHGSLRGAYARGSNYQAVELPYLSESVRMLVVLPDEGQLSAVEARLTSGLFDDARASRSEYQIDLGLPRFSFRAAFELPAALKALGMQRAFTGDADFSGIAGPPGYLYIDNVYHQAFVAVDESGTEAAAATAVVITRESEPQRVSVTFDRPFLFFIFDEPTGQILFAGRLSEPA